MMYRHNLLVHAPYKRGEEQIKQIGTTLMCSRPLFASKVHVLYLFLPSKSKLYSLKSAVK